MKRLAVNLDRQVAIEGNLDLLSLEGLDLLKAGVIAVLRKQEHHGGIRHAQRRMGDADVEETIVQRGLRCNPEPAAIGGADVHGHEERLPSNFHIIIARSGNGGLSRSLFFTLFANFFDRCRFRVGIRLRVGIKLSAGIRLRVGIKLDAGIRLGDVDSRGDRNVIAARFCSGIFNLSSHSLGNRDHLGQTTVALLAGNAEELRSVAIELKMMEELVYTRRQEQRESLSLGLLATLDGIEGDARIDTEGKSLHEVLAVHAADVYELAVAAHQTSHRLGDVGRHVDALSVVVSGAHGDDAYNRAIASRQGHEAVHHLMNDAVAAQHHQRVVLLAEVRCDFASMARIARHDDIEGIRTQKTAQIGCGNMGRVSTTPTLRSGVGNEQYFSVG